MRYREKGGDRKRDRERIEKEREQVMEAENSFLRRRQGMA